VTADAARRAGLPFLVTVHELPPEATGGRQAARLRRALSQAGLVVATSEYLAERLVAGGWAEAGRVRVVPRWVDLAEFDPDRVRGHRVAAAAERCGLSVGPKVVAVPTEVAAGDGRELLATSLARLARQDFRLLLLGPLPAGRDAVRRLTERLGEAGLAERVRFGTDLADLPGALALVDVLLVPATRPRASSRLVAAAQAMGRPVIVTTAGALGEAVMPAVTGWLLPPDDPGEIAWALDLALRMEEDVRERVGRRAREFAAASFAAPVMLERKLALYRELLSAPRPAAPPPPAAAGDAGV
jgi:glycosyltransferase involved in cell wall biosynthesis